MMMMMILTPYIVTDLRIYLIIRIMNIYDIPAYELLGVKDNQIVEQSH